MDLLSATPLEGYKARLSYEGKTVEVDLTPLLHGFTGVWAPHRDPAFFNQMYVEDGVLTWPNGTDVDPYVLQMIAIGCKGDLYPWSTPFSNS